MASFRNIQENLITELSEKAAYEFTRPLLALLRATGEREKMSCDNSRKVEIDTTVAILSKQVELTNPLQSDTDSLHSTKSISSVPSHSDQDSSTAAVVAPLEAKQPSVENGIQHADIESIPHTSVMKAEKTVPNPDKLGEKIPYFSGLHAHWVIFRSRFLNEIHSNKRVSLAEKLVTLKRAIPADIWNQIKSDDYTRAWDNLCSLYQTVAPKIMEKMAKLIEFPSIKTPNDANQLMLLIDTTVDLLGLLAASGYEKASFGASLQLIIIEKMDATLAQKWANKLAAPDFNLDQLLNFIHDEAVDCAARGKNPKQAGLTLKPTGQNCKLVELTTRCIYCNSSNHELVKCNGFLGLNTQGRIFVLKQQQRCLRCLKGPHPLGDCTPAVCVHCGGNHHRLVCYQNTPPTKQNKQKHN